MKKYPGWIGWTGIVLYIAIWDGIPRNQTLSDAWYNAWSGNTKGKLTTLVAWSITTTHLFYPMKHDPINLIGRAYGKLRR